MMQNALYGGINAAVLTAMGPDGAIDLDRTAVHARHLLANGCDGLGILGTTGEANSLGVSERIGFMEGLCERGIPAAKLMPGTGMPSVFDTVALTKTAIALGCPGVLVLPPFFYKNPSEDGLFAFFSEVVQRTGGEAKLFLYHFPAQSAVPITLKLVERLLRAHPGVVKGVKDSSGDFANTSAYVENFAAEGFEVYCGDDAALQRLLAAGGAGCITAASNVGSPWSARVYRDWNVPAGAEAQAILAAIRAAVTKAALIPALKALVARNTGDEGWLNIRPPHRPLDADAAQAVFDAFDASGAIPAARAA